MNFFKKLLESKAIQGDLSMAVGALILSLETAYPMYAPLIDKLSIILLSGGFMHSVHGRITAAGPITDTAPTAPGTPKP